MMIPVPIRKHQFHWRHPALFFFFHSNNTTDFIFLFAFLLFQTSYTIFFFFKGKFLFTSCLSCRKKLIIVFTSSELKLGTLVIHEDSLLPWASCRRGGEALPPSQVEQLFADAFNECFSCHQMRKMWKIFLDLLFHITRFECVVIIQYSLPANAIYVQQINYGR